MASKSEMLEIELVIQTKQALDALVTLDSGTKEFERNINIVRNSVKMMADTMGISFSAAAENIGMATGMVKSLNIALAEYATLRTAQNEGLANKELAQEKILALENRETQENREQLALMQRMAAEDAKRLANDGRGMLFSPGQPSPVMPNSMNTGRFAGQYGKFDTGAGTAMYDSWKNVGPMLQETGKKAEGAARGFNVLRTAAGFLTAMILSKIATGIVQVFQKIIDSAAQAEQAFIKLSIAQKAITRGGTAISSNELLGIIDKVAAAYLSVSKIDAQKMVSSLAVLTKDLKLSASEYEKMAMAIPLIAQQAGVSIESATDQVITGLTKSGRGWADLGITVDAEIIKQKAVSSGLVKTREAYEALTAEQKQQVEVLALLEILEENTIDNKAKQEAYNNTLSGSQVALNAAWEDFAATLGKFAAPGILSYPR